MPTEREDIIAAPHPTPRALLLSHPHCWVRRTLQPDGDAGAEAYTLPLSVSTAKGGGQVLAGAKPGDPEVEPQMCAIGCRTRPLFQLSP